MKCSEVYVTAFHGVLEKHCFCLVDGPSAEVLQLLQRLHFYCEFITHLAAGSQCCGCGIHGNSVAYSRSFYSNCMDSLQQMSEMPSLRVTPKTKSTTLMTKPWPKIKT